MKTADYHLQNHLHLVISLINLACFHLFPLCRIPFTPNPTFAHAAGFVGTSCISLVIFKNWLRFPPGRFEFISSRFRNASCSERRK